ncbi:MAG TPA: hypothetical protein VFX11_00540, partial [Candidatus Kapabacteria bacterium]|nr:hypothetical protein [Candidatus Kapabacteria bacterium]
MKFLLSVGGHAGGFRTDLDQAGRVMHRIPASILPLSARAAPLSARINCSLQQEHASCQLRHRRIESCRTGLLRSPHQHELLKNAAMPLRLIFIAALLLTCTFSRTLLAAPLPAPADIEAS